MKNIINKTVATIEIKEVEKYILNIDEKANKSFIPVNIYIRAILFTKLVSESFQKSV